MAALVSSVRKGLLSCGILPSLWTASTSVKFIAQDVNIRMVNFQNLKMQIRRISTFSFLASVSRISTCKMSFQSRQLVGAQSVYRFGSSSDFLKRTDGFFAYNKKTVVITRNINTKSKLGKRKTCKAVTKRFIRTGKGKLKRWRAGKNHKMMHKGPKRSMRLRKATYVNKQQLKLLNKMLNGW